MRVRPLLSRALGMRLQELRAAERCEDWKAVGALLARNVAVTEMRLKSGKRERGMHPSSPATPGG